MARRWITAALPLVVGLLLASCAANRPGAFSQWTQEVAAELGGELARCVVADFDPNLSGDEIAVLAGDGSVHLIWRDGGVWHLRQPFRLAGRVIGACAGDLIASREGAELVALGPAEGDDGGRGRATALGLSAGGGSWLKVLIESEASIHAGVLADLEPDRPGDELVYGGLFGEARLVGRGAPRSLGALPGHAEGVASGVGGVVFACDDGSLVRFRRREEGGFEKGLLARVEASLAGVAASTQEVLFCADDGGLRLWKEGQTRELLHLPRPLRGVVLADLDPSHPGVEYATTGDDGRVRLVRGEEVSVVGRDGAGLRDLASGVLPGLGPCLVACGSGGAVIVMHPLSSGGER